MEITIEKVDNGFIVNGYAIHKKIFRTMEEALAEIVYWFKLDPYSKTLNYTIKIIPKEE